MTNDELRTQVAGLMRELGHAFVGKDIDDDTLMAMRESLAEQIERLHARPSRVRTRPEGGFAAFKMAVPEHGEGERRQLFADSIVSGGANPMGLGAWLWRDGDQAVMEANLGKAFEGAPQRAHGGIVAALIDETMGLVLAIHEALAFTVQLDITYLAPTPINETIYARAWLERKEGRKMFMRAEVTSGTTTIAEASSLFIEVDPTKFLAH
jgi:acyl-coenzyme A thioesterase PaaI-like protein